MSEVFCGAEPCPVILNSTCVFYRGQDLLYIGVNTNDNLQIVIEKINQAFQNTGIGYAFTNGVVQPAPNQPVQLGGALIQNTTIGGAYTLTFVGNVQAAKHITTGGTASQFVKGDGTLDSTSYQPAGNYLTGLSGDGTASGPGVGVFTLTQVNFAPGTFGNGSTIPIVTVNSKGLVTNITSTPIVVPPQPLIFIGDVVGSGFTGTNVTLLLQNVNSNIYGSNTFLKFAVNGKGLVTSAAPVTQSDIISALGYTPISSANIYTQSQINSFFAGSAPISGYNKVNWDIAYGDKINSAAVTGGGTKTLTLYQQDGGIITASWTESPATVSSVFGRTGAVIAQSGDYNTSQVTENTNLYFTESRVLSTLLSGYVSNPGTITAADSILSAIQKLNGNISALTTGVSSVNGFTGAVTLTTSNINEGTNLYFTGARVLSTLLSGYTLGTNTPLSATDSVLTAFQNIQAQINNLVTLGTDQTITGIKTFTKDIFVNGVRVGRGQGDTINTTVLGNGALNSDISAGGHVAIGRQALFGNTTAVSNVAIGQFTLGFTTTGGENTAIGHNAGIGSNSNITGSNNIFIGRGSSGESSSESNRTWIGNSSTVSTWVGGNLLVGTRTNSTFKLDINGTARIQSDLTVTATNATGDFATIDASNILRRRTPAQTLSDIGAQAVLTNPVTGTGTSGQVAFWNGTTTQTGDSKLTWNNTEGGLIINSQSINSLRGLNVNQSNDGVQAAYIEFKKSRGTIASPTNVNTNDLVAAFTFSARVGGAFTSDRALFGANMASSTGIGLYFCAGSSNGSYNPSIYVHPTQNVVIGSSQSILTGITDAGFRLDVNGTARVQGNLTTNLTLGSVPFIGTSGLLTQDNSNLFWDNINKRLGIGTNAPSNQLHISDGNSVSASVTDGAARLFLSRQTGVMGIYGSVASVNAGDRTIYAGIRSRGTLSSPLAVQAGDFGVTFLSGLFDGSAIQNSAGIFFDAESNASVGSAPQLINLVTGSTGANRTAKLQVRSNGNVIIQNGGTFTDAGFRLDVNGTARVQGALTTNLTATRIPFIGTGGVLSDSANFTFNDGRLTINRSTDSRIFIQDNGVTIGQIQAVSTAFRISTLGDLPIEFYTNSGLRWTILNTGTLQANVSSTIQTLTGNLTLATAGGNGNIVLSPNGTGTISITDAKNIALGTTTGTKIGTATTQKLGFWNAAPIVQPTTAIASATRVGGGGTALTDTDTFDGYTLAQIVKGLRNMGAFA